jgi:hypothetical protein
MIAGPLTEKSFDQLCQREQVSASKRASPVGQCYEHIGVGLIRPRPGQGLQGGALIEKEHAVLSPGLPDGDERERAARPRVERVRHTDNLHMIVWIRRG